MLVADLEPCPMLFVVAPRLPLEFACCQVLLVCGWLVVERKEEGLRVQALKQGGAVHRSRADAWVALWPGTWWHCAHPGRHGAPQRVRLCWHATPEPPSNADLSGHNIIKLRACTDNCGPTAGMPSARAICVHSQKIAMSFMVSVDL